MPSMNEVTLLGRMTRDAEVKKTSTGKSFCRITVACDRFGREKETDFVPVVVWNQSADYLGNYGRKGSLIAVQGNIRTGSFQNKDGQTVYTTDVAATRVQLILEKKASENKYSSMGTPLRKEDVDANDGFENAGPTYFDDSDSYDEVPF